MVSGEQSPIGHILAADAKAGELIALNATRYAPLIDAGKAGDYNALATTGQWNIPKPTAAVFTAGAPVGWNPTGTPDPSAGDAGGGAAAASGAGVALLGFCVEPSGAGEAYVLVRLSVVAATVTGAA